MKERLRNLLRKTWRPLVGIAGFLGLTIYTGGGCADRRLPPAGVAAAGEELPADARTLVARRTAEPARAEAPGTIESETRIQLSARLPAHVRRVWVTAGSEVREGQELIALDDRDIREQLAAAEAQLRQAEAEFQRTSRLRADGAATEQQLLAAETARDGARAQVERARVLLSYTVIVSPIAGVVTDRRVEEGDLAGPGQPLLSVYDPTRMRIEAPVPSRLISYLRPGQAVEVALTHPAGVRRAVVKEIVSEIDPATRTQKVKALLEDATGLRPGAFGRLVFTTDPVETLRVPETAVRRVGQLETVQVVRDGRVLRRLVRTGARRDGLVEVLSGLEDGETIVVGRGAEERP